MNFVNPVEEFAKAGEAVDRRWEAQQEDQAFQKLSELAQDPQYKGQPISQFLEAAGAKALESGSAKFGLKLMNQASLAQVREATAAENQIQAEERQLDTMQSTVVGLKAIKDPVERATASVNALKALGSRTPPQQRPMIDKAIADIQQNPQKADGYLNYFETAFKTSKARLSEQNLLLKGAQIEAQILRAENDAIRKTRKDAQDQVGFLAEYGQPVPKSLARAAGMNVPDEAPLSVRNNNPGNLRDPKTGEFRQFATPEEGRKALTADLAGKLEGTSPAYKAKFGDAPITPERLAEVWSPASAEGNSAASTRNYGKAIADALGIKVGEKIANTPENREKIANAITAFESGQPVSDTIELVKQKPMASTDIARAQRSLQGANAAAARTESLMKFPAGTTTGVLPNITTKDGLTNAFRNYAARTISSDEADMMNTLFAGLGRDLAAVETGGLATGLTELSKKLESGLYINPGQDTPFKVAMKLADIRMVIEEHIEPSIGVTIKGEQAKVAHQIVERIKKAVPYTANDVIEAQKKSLSGKDDKGAQSIGETTKAAVAGNNTVTVAGGVTYTRPKGMSDASWNAYVQQYGVKQ